VRRRKSSIGLLLVADQDAAAAVEPPDRPLDDPPPGRRLLLARRGVQLLLPDLADVRLVPEDPGRSVRGLAAERLVQAQVLFVLARVGRPRPTFSTSLRPYSHSRRSTSARLRPASVLFKHATASSGDSWWIFMEISLCAKALEGEYEIARRTNVNWGEQFFVC